MTDEKRAARFLDLTGLTPEGLRESLPELATHRAVFEFLCAHEPDLVAAAQALEIDPAVIAAGKEGLSR